MKHSILISVCMLSLFSFSQKNDTLIPDLSIKGNPSWFSNEYFLNDLSDVYGKVSSFNTNFNPVISIRRINFSWRLNSYLYDLNNAVEDFTVLKLKDSLISRSSSVGLGYTLLQGKRIFIQPIIEISTHKFKFFNSFEQLNGFKSISYGIGGDIGYSISSTRLNRFSNLFFDLGIGVQVRYYYSERYPIYLTNLNNHVIFYSFTIYTSVGLWDVFKKNRK